MNANNLSFGCTDSNVIRDRIVRIAPFSSPRNMPCDFFFHFSPCVLAVADIHIASFALCASFPRRGVDDRPVISGVIFLNSPFLQLIGVLAFPRNGQAATSASRFMQNIMKFVRSSKAMLFSHIFHGSG